MRWYPKTPGDFNKNLKTNQGVSQKPRGPSPTTTNLTMYFSLLNWSIIKFQHYLFEGKKFGYWRTPTHMSHERYGFVSRVVKVVMSWTSLSHCGSCRNRNQTSDIPNKINKQKHIRKFRVCHFKMMAKQQNEVSFEKTFNWFPKTWSFLLVFKTF